MTEGQNTNIQNDKEQKAGESNVSESLSQMTQDPAISSAPASSTDPGPPSGQVSSTDYKSGPVVATDPGPPPDPNEINPNAPPTPISQAIDLSKKKKNLAIKFEKFDIVLSKLKKIFKVFNFLKSPLEDFSYLDTVEKLKVTLMVLIVVLLGVIVKYWGYDWAHYFELDLLNNLEDKATTVTRLDFNEEYIDFDHSLLVPQYMVLLNKVVVNLQRSESSGENPMAAFDFYLQTTNEETAKEVKKRERELQDYVQRISEGLSYDQLITENGKKKWKITLKSQLNTVLTQGKIKNIYFKTLLIKP